MYKEIHPWYHDTVAEAAVVMGDKSQPSSAFYKQTDSSVILRLDTIRQIRSETSYDGTVNLKRLVISDDYLQDILISNEEAEAIKKMLLSQKEPLADEVSRLTAAVRDLWNLLRARMR